MLFEGITTALITPLTKTNEVDEKALESLINKQIKSGVQNLLVLGGTGEYSTLTNEERKKCIDIAVRVVNRRVPLMVGIVDPGIGDAIDIGLYAKKAGANGILSVTPFYNKSTQEGIYNHYKQLDQALDMPIILYNMPVKTGVNMLPATVEKLVNDIPNIVAIKECSPNLAQTLELIRLVGSKITVLAGEEHNAVAAMIFGAKGAIMATANLFPEIWLDFYQKIQQGEYETAVEENLGMYPVFNALFKEGNPIPLKEAMQMKNIIPSNTVNTPLTSPQPSTVSELENCLKEVGL